MLDSLIRDRTVVGILDNGTRKRLLQEPKLTLIKCTDICRSSAEAALQLHAMSNQEDLKFVSDVGLTSKASKSDKSGSTVSFCKFCGKRRTRRKEECLAWGKNCNICAEKNHFALKYSKSLRQSREQPVKPCKQRKKKQLVHAMSQYSSSAEHLLTVGSRVGKYCLLSELVC